MKKLLIIFFSLIGYLFSQLYNFHYYTTKDGLTSTSVKCITQDYRGYIWIGTTSSVFRYDGYVYEEIGKWNENLKTEITGIANFNKQIWISTASKGIFVIKTNKKVINLSEKFAYLPKEIKILKYSSNRILFISSGNEFFVALSDSQISKILVDALLPQTEFNDIVSIDNGYAIASNDGLIIYQYSRIKYIFNQDKYGEKIAAQTIALDKNKNILFTDQRGKIFKVENYTLVEVANFNNESTNTSLLVDNTNSIWFGSDFGVIRIENNKQRFIGFPNGLPHQVVTELFEDREGNIWIGTLNGVVKLNSLAIRNYPSLFPKVTSSIYKIFKWGNEISIYTDEGISVYNSKEETFSNFTVDFSNSKNVNDVISLSNNFRLIGTDNGLFLLQNNKLVYSPLNSQISTKKILSLASGKDEKIYVGTDSSLFIFQKNKLIDYLSIDNILPGNEVNAILVDRAGDIFIGTDNGLVKYSDETSLVLRTENGLINNFITSLSEGPDGRIWIGTKNGLSSFKNGRFNNFILRTNGYTANEIKDVLVIQGNEIWVGTVKGVFIIKNEVDYSVLTTKDGLLSDFITDLEYDEQNKIVFIGTNSGLTIIDLKHLKENNFTYKIYFTGFSTDKKNYDLDNIIVDRDEGTIKVNVSIFSFFDERKIVYRYRIKEIEDNWNYLAKSNVIKYKNLSPGNYTLIVQASIDGIKWLNNSAELKFKIQSSLLKNILLYSSFLVGLIFLYLISLFVRNSLVKWKKGNRTIDNKTINLEKGGVYSPSDKIEVVKLYTKEEVTELLSKLKSKIETMSKMLFEKDQLIAELREENNELKNKLNAMENTISGSLEDFEDEIEIIAKSKIEIIVKNSKEAEEIKRYVEALEKTNWSIRAAAKLLNIPHSTFHYRLKKWNLLKNKRELGW